MESSSKPKEWLLNGIVITLPIVVTFIVLMVVLEFLLGMLSPIVMAVTYLWSNEPSTAAIELITILALVAFFLAVGIVADITPGKHISQVVNTTVETIPGVGTVYTSVRQASKIVADDDTDQFQDVKLIEFPHQNAYMVSFLIGDTPENIEDSLEVGDMVTVMVPLGPNPTTNGFVMHMPAESVHDVDLTVEEAIQSIATLGVAEVKNGRHD